MTTDKHPLRTEVSGPLVTVATHADPAAALARTPLRRRKDIATFLLLTFSLSSLAWTPILSTRALNAGGGLFVALGMWCPGLAAIVTRLLFQRNLHGVGWLPGKPRYLVFGYAVPLGLTALVYGGVWLTGIGRFAPGETAASLTTKVGLTSDPGTALVPFWLAATGTFVVLLSGLTALGEELGWRGFLVPELVRSTSFHRAALISGGVWAVWHAPVIVFADYNAGTPAWYSLACFSAMVVSAGVVFAWLRLRSGSIWSAVLLARQPQRLHPELLRPCNGQHRAYALRHYRVRLRSGDRLVCSRGVPLAEAAAWAGARRRRRT